MREAEFQRLFLDDAACVLDGMFYVKNDEQLIQGIPDLTLFCGPYWAWIEVKAHANAAERPNQRYYIDLANRMGAYGAFVYPENEREVLHDLQRAFSPQRYAR